MHFCPPVYFEYEDFFFYGCTAGGLVRFCTPVYLHYCSMLLHIGKAHTNRLEKVAQSGGYK